MLETSGTWHVKQTLASLLPHSTAISNSAIKPLKHISTSSKEQRKSTLHLHPSKFCAFHHKQVATDMESLIYIESEVSSMDSTAATS
jgi:hypothetical protein